MNTWITSDYHFDHDNLCVGSSKWTNKGGCRPFSCAAEMGEILLEKTNKLVKDQDHLIILGDMVVGSPKKLERYAYWRQRINCDKIWYCRGNHSPHNYDDPIEDRSIMISLGYLFDQVFDYKVVRLARRWITLSHYFLGTFYQQSKGGIALGGHSHGSLTVPQGIRWKDCGVDCNVKDPWSPFHIDEIISEMRQIERISYDHHH